MYLSLCEENWEQWSVWAGVQLPACALNCTMGMFVAGFESL